jgi:2-desacetyl-2-hydroxyethyl bacteriochlorophyllide A dehydrogenase
VRAVVFEGVGRVKVREVPDPRIEHPEDAVVGVTTAAICGSDLHFLHGKAPLEPGETIGHEAVGIIERVGEGVERFRPGERVVVAFDIVCGECWFCRHGQTQLCDDFRNLGAGVFGGDLGGAQAEMLRVPHADVNLLRIPEELEDERAVFLGDVLTTGFYGASLAAPAQDEVVAVVGAGPVGFCSAQAAKVLGARRVLLLDMEPQRLALAALAGAEPVNVRERHPATAVADATEGRGADVVIEAVGTPEGLETAVNVVRRGGRICVVGMFTSETVEIPLGIWWARALDVRFAGICPVHVWWARALAELEAGRMDPRPLVSHRLPLADAAEGYELFESRRATKVLLIP